MDRVCAGLRRWGRGPCVLALLISNCVCATFTSPRHAGAAITAQQVEQAINGGVDYLRRTAQRGHWTDHAGQVGGVSCLCTLALLNCGVPASDPLVQESLVNLRRLEPRMTYTVALQTMVFCAAEPEKDMLLIRRNVKWLEENQVRQGRERKGGWSYPTESMNADNSNTQFAMLALHEAERVGVPVNESTWKIALDYWKGSQSVDGSWGYPFGGGGSGSMTCAGVTSLIIASGALNKGDAFVEADRVHCCGKQESNKAIESALAWLDRNFTVSTNPGVGSWNLYYLYGLERVGRMSARRFIGNHDWYREGADYLVARQDQLSHYWIGAGHGESTPAIATSFALLFLSKGRRPILMSKLKHGDGTDWNRHRGDVFNLTTYTESRWKRDLSWQIIDVATAEVDDLLQSPVLFLNGRDMPQFSEEQTKRLRDYVDRGGFIFAEACCSGAKFEEGFRKLVRNMYPEKEFQLRLLDRQHPIWFAEETVDPQYTRPLWGLDVGCRTSIVMCPDDLSCYWELARARNKALPKTARGQVQACLSIGINVLAYATNREVKFKYESFDQEVKSKSKDDFQRGRIYAARLQHAGGCNVAPLAAGNLMRTAGAKLKLRVSDEVREVAPTDPQLFNYHLIFMHGRFAFRFTPRERKAMQTYLERGGILVSDAICSSKDFTESFRREMKTMLPESPLARIPADNALFTSKFGGDDLKLLARRQSGAAGEGPMHAEARLTEPYLEGLQIDGRYSVLFSPYDMSCALENQESIECEGYTRKDAARLGLNILLYSLHE